MLSDSEAQPEWLDVSRETFDLLGKYLLLVRKWNPVINLVSKADLDNLWTRHLLDSAQLFYHAPLEARSWCDLGSGGGFPGVVVAIMAAEKAPKLAVTLVEVDRRKAVFLTEACRQLGIKATVLTERIDRLAPQQADVISARALAPLANLCDFAQRHMSPSGVAIFPKGRAAQQEVDDARLRFSFNLTKTQSIVDPEACVLCLRDIHHA